MGLKSEINKEQRMHSVIMVTTLQKLINHGIVITNRGVSDGEIAIDPNKNFNQFLFMYKPQGEFYSLVNFLEKGGISREELLTQLRNTAVERAIKQGLPLNQPEALPNVYPSDDDIQEMLDELDYEEKTDYFQQEVEEKQGIRMSWLISMITQTYLHKKSVAYNIHNFLVLIIKETTDNVVSFLMLK